MKIRLETYMYRTRLEGSTFLLSTEKHADVNKYM